MTPAQWLTATMSCHPTRSYHQPLGDEATWLLPSLLLWRLCCCDLSSLQKDSLEDGYGLWVSMAFSAMWSSWHWERHKECCNVDGAYATELLSFVVAGQGLGQTISMLQAMVEHRGNRGSWPITPHLRLHCSSVKEFFLRTPFLSLDCDIL